MNRVLVDFLIKVYVAKLPDDLYISGNDIESLTSTWRKVLTTLSRANLQLTSGKTTICPKKTSILGWIQSKDSLTEGPHKISTLSSCQPPKTVKDLRSFIGIYNDLNHVIANWSHFLSLLDEARTRKESEKPSPTPRDTLHQQRPSICHVLLEQARSSPRNKSKIKRKSTTEILPS